MKPLIRATRNHSGHSCQWSPFEFESFEVRVRRIARHKPLPIGVSFRRMNIHRPPRQFKTIPRPIDAAQRAKNFLPSPSLQGLGLMCLRTRGRPVDRPAALSSRQLHASASNSANLGLFGLRLDCAANFHCKPDADVAQGDSPRGSWSFPCREDLTLLRETRRVICPGSAMEVSTERIRNG